MQTIEMPMTKFAVKECENSTADMSPARLQAGQRPCIHSPHGVCQNVQSRPGLCSPAPYGASPAKYTINIATNFVGRTFHTFADAILRPKSSRTNGPSRKAREHTRSKAHQNCKHTQASGAAGN
jgi:hypothetical protein